MELGDLMLPGDAVPAGSEMPAPEVPMPKGEAPAAAGKLKDFSDDDLIAELKARGFEIEQEDDEGEKEMEVSKARESETTGGAGVMA